VPRELATQTFARTQPRAYPQYVRWAEALELAAQHSPSDVPEILKHAGHVYHERGQHRRLWRVLSRLPEALRQDETVLFWRLACAVRLGRESEIRAEVESHLAAHEAPELRALYAGTLASMERLLEEAERAYRAARTPHTAYANVKMWSIEDDESHEVCFRTRFHG
jgi:hypothetical protein